MVRPSWRTGSCDTCRNRKVKCDKLRPVCKRCRKAGRVCEGRYQDGTRVYLPTLPQREPIPRESGLDAQSLNQFLYRLSMDSCLRSPSPISQYLCQLLSTFLSDYAPSQSIEGGSTHHTSFSWIESLPCRLGNCLLLDIALAALSLAFIGKRSRNSDLIYWSKRYYALVVARIRILRQQTDSYTEDVIGTAMILSIYELYSCSRGQTHSWIIHVHAACSLLEERGPNRPVDRNLYCRIRTVALYDACARRKSTFLARPEWRAVSSNHDEYDQLLDILVSLPSILELSDLIKSALCPLNQLEGLKMRFLDLFLATETQLWKWYTSLLGRQSAPPFITRPATSSELALLLDDSDLLHTFPEVVQFSNRYLSHLLLHSWLGFHFLYASALEVMRTLDISLNRNPTEIEWAPRTELSMYLVDRERAIIAGHPGQTRHMRARGLDEIEAVAECFAVRLCQAMVSGENYSYGSAMRQPVMATLWMAQQFFKDRFPKRFLWCQTVLQRLENKGLAYSAELVNLSYQGYGVIVDQVRREAVNNRIWAF